MNKFKIGDKVRYSDTSSKSMFAGLVGEIVEITDNPFNMYIVSFFQGIRVGIIERYLEEV